MQGVCKKVARNLEMDLLNQNKERLSQILDVKSFNAYLSFCLYVSVYTNIRPFYS